MPALSVIDLAMFLIETPERPFNVGPLIVLRPPARFRGNFADKLVARMLKRPLGPPFNYRLEVVRLGAPRLVIDENANVENHLHRISLDGAATLDEVFSIVCELHETRIDRSRLLWELHVIDGIEGGRVALYGKVHHGIIDGRTFVKVISHWLSTEPGGKVHAMWEGLPRPASESRARASIVRGVTRALGSAVGAAASTAALYRMLGQQALHAAGVGSGDGLSLPFVRIPGALKAAASSKRSYAFCSLPLERMKALGKANDVTVNDVLLTTLDIALHAYLRDRGQRPDRPLIADMPLALADARGGNQIAVLQFPLGKSDATPSHRLAEIKRQTAKVKNALKSESSETVMLFTTLVHSLPAMLEKAGVKRAPRVSNLLVSNPFGLTEKRYLMGAEVELALPMSVVAAGQELNVTAVTLADRLQLGFLAMPEAVPALGHLADHTVAAFAELESALALKSKRPAGRRTASGARAGRAVNEGHRRGALQ